MGRKTDLSNAPNDNGENLARGRAVGDIQARRGGDVVVWSALVHDKAVNLTCRQDT